MKVLFYSFLITFFTTTTGHAAGKCGDKILENDAVNLHNVRNQGKLGWCYAYVAADLLSFKLNKKISAVSLNEGLQDLEQEIDPDKLAMGGDVGESIRKYIAKNNGLCLEEDLPSSDFKFCLDTNYKDFLNELLWTVREGRLENELNTNQCFNQSIQVAFPGLNPSLLRNYAKSQGTNRLIEYLYSLQCKKVSFPNIKVNTKTYITKSTPTKKMLETINAKIASGEVVGIGYDYDILTGQKKDDEPGDHSSIVVGRGENPETGACEYLVRNNYGKDCDLQDRPGVRCHKNCKGTDCRYSGHFWITEDKLKESLLGIMHL